jgi:hypothetical protein
MFSRQHSYKAYDSALITVSVFFIKSFSENFSTRKSLTLIDSVGHRWRQVSRVQRFVSDLPVAYDKSISERNCQHQAFICKVFCVF